MMVIDIRALQTQINKSSVHHSNSMSILRRLKKVYKSGVGSAHCEEKWLIWRGSKLSLRWLWRKFPPLKRNFCFFSPLPGQQQGTALEAKLAEKGRKYKKEHENISIVLEYNLSWSGKQKKGLARGTMCMGQFRAKVPVFHKPSLRSDQGWTVGGRT